MQSAKLKYQFCVKIFFRRGLALALLRSMNVDTGIWGRLTRVALVLLVIAGLMLVAVWYLPPIRQNERMRKEIQRLDTAIEKETTQQNQIKAASDALRNDPKATERLAREKLGYAKPGETVIRYEQPSNDPPQSVAQ
jgi:cell division protein FtsB